MRTPASPLLTIENALLGFVYEHPRHGYDIYQQLLAPDGLWQVWRLKQGQLYALLAKLEEAGHVTVTLQPQEARPPRKIFALTSAGRSAFLNWRSSPVDRGRQMRSEFLAKLYFACRQDIQAADSLLAEQTSTCQVWLTDLQRTVSSSPEDTFIFAVRQFRIHQVQAFIAWLATCRQALGLPSRLT